MESKALVVCVVVGFLGVLSAALAFAAEANKTKASDVRISTNGVCIYPESPALALGLAAALALIVAQVMINTVSGCICCKRRQHFSGNNWTVALITFIISWVTLVIAFLLLLTGAALNSQRDTRRTYLYNECYVVKPGVFSGGAVLSLASVGLGIVYFLAVSSSKHPESWGAQAQQSQGIAMAHPQIPPQSAQPVFVHEDTYNRRQLA